jgi:hypothetical protein
MGILLGFLPFLAFAFLSGPLGPVLALLLGAGVSAALSIRTVLTGGSLKILELGTLVLFVAVALFAAIAGRDLSIFAVRLCVDGGLLAIVLLSMALRRPFTMQYAREQVPREYWDSPRFLRTNYVITSGWAVAFLVMVMAEAAMLAAPDLPRSLGKIVIVAALLGAVYFTKLRSEAARAAPDPAG